MIMALDTMEAISSFFGWQSNILFLVDQVNSLEMDLRERDYLSNETKGRTFAWIVGCAVGHRFIFGASASNRNRDWIKESKLGHESYSSMAGFPQ
jgi:hypothetical protein